MDREEAGQRYRALPEHPGAVARRRWDSLRRCHAIHIRNTAEVKQLLAAFYTNRELATEVIQNVRPSEVQEAFWDEMSQRVHNYLASSSTLIDHTRRFMSAYEGSRFEDEYGERVEQIRAAPVADVVKGCRNLMLHVSQLPIVTRLQFDRETGERSDIHLSTERLLEWDGWTAAARGYLSQIESGELDLLAAIEEYETLIENLYRWMYEQFEELHGEDIEGYNAELRELNVVLWGDPAGPRP